MGRGFRFAWRRQGCHCHGRPYASSVRVAPASGSCGCAQSAYPGHQGVRVAPGVGVVKRYHPQQVAAFHGGWRGCSDPSTADDADVSRSRSASRRSSCRKSRHPTHGARGWWWCCQMSTFIATDSGPVSRLGTGLPADAPVFRSLGFSGSLRLSYHCPGLSDAGFLSQTGEIGAVHGAHSDPLFGDRPKLLGSPTIWRGALCSRAKGYKEAYLPRICGQRLRSLGWGEHPMSFLPKRPEGRNLARHGAMNTSR